MISPASVLRTRTLGLLLLSLQPLYSTAVFAQAERQPYSIDASPLDQALSRFGVQAGISMAGNSTLTAGKRSNGLRGDFSTEAGLARLLAGTGLSFQRQADGSFELHPATSAVVLPSQKVIGDDIDKKAVYSAPRSAVYLSPEEVQRFGVISAGDLLKGLPGVQVGDSRNGGGLDVNIRGIQGQSRVAVTVDGSQQALDVYRGYAGTQQRTQVFPASVGKVITGYTYAKKQSDSAGAFSPAFGVNFEVAPDTFLYASYTQGLRMPSLFESSLGTLQTLPGKGLKPERSSNWEIGASTMQKGLLADNDSAAIKLAYFNNSIKNYITRYYDPTPGQNGLMNFSNTDSFKTSGLELQSNYDAGRVFADLSATYYLKTETCDSAFAARLRASSTRLNDLSATPNCTPGSFMGSYTNTQNPPRASGNLTTGLRFFDQTLTVGGRLTYTSGPTVTADKNWQTGATTPQLVYREVALFDLFLNYKWQDHTNVNLSLQNLTDRYYLDPLAQSFMPAPGRTLRMGW